MRQALWKLLNDLTLPMISRGRKYKNTFSVNKVFITIFVCLLLSSSFDPQSNRICFLFYVLLKLAFVLYLVWLISKCNLTFTKNSKPEFYFTCSMEIIHSRVCGGRKLVVLFSLTRDVHNNYQIIIKIMTKSSLAFNILQIFWRATRVVLLLYLKEFLIDKP